MNDIYFETNYGKLYESIEDGVCEVFNFKHSLGAVRHLFIKRKIPDGLLEESYYDLTTPYGYGGPVMMNVENGKQDELAAEFHRAFQVYCDEQKIVSEFIRFHPIFENARDFKSIYNVSFKRKTVQTRLADSDDPALTQYSSSCRKEIRRGIRAGMEYRVIRNPDQLDNFKKIYYSTMERNKALSVYYFNDDYFSQCLSYFGENIVVVEVLYQQQVVGASLNFISGNRIHAHLTGTLQEFHHLFPANILQYGLALWGKENGMEMIHHGGGRTGDPQDSLYLFKKKFGKEKELDFWVAEKVWNKEVYEQLCEKAGRDRNVESDIFPAYRLVNSGNLKMVENLLS